MGWRRETQSQRHGKETGAEMRAWAEEGMEWDSGNWEGMGMEK